MRLFDVLKRLSFVPFLMLIGLGLRNLWFISPTIKATRKTVALSYEHYGKKHHVNGPANAFRHALWNYQIAKACSERSNNGEKVLRWTEEITDWHEKAFPNEKLAKLMDLHNNRIGRKLYKIHPHLGLKAVVTKLKKMTEESVLIKNESDFTVNKNNLVHIIK